MADLNCLHLSDGDGVRHVVLSRQDDEPAGWRVLVWDRDDDPDHTPPRRTAVLRRRTVWGEPGNFLGFGAPRLVWTAVVWTAVVDWDEVAKIEIDGVRSPVVETEKETP